jgi:hypothetical protein
MAENPIVLPDEPGMATEPAVTIGEVFANKAVIQPAIAAVVSIAAGIFKFTADTSDLVDQLTTLVLFLGIVWGALSAQWEARRRAKEQALVTREAVYAPATVEAIAHEQYVAGLPPTEAQPPVPPPAAVP